MTYEEARKFVESNCNIVVPTSRSWNNSMGIHSDSVCIWKDGKPEWHSLGIDYLDGIKVEIDKDSDEYKAFLKSRHEGEKRFRRLELIRQAVRYEHHGRLTALRIVRYFDTLSSDDRRILHSLLKVRKFRSKFRANLCDQVLSYVRARQSQRKYAFPLSWKQKAAIARYA